MEPPAEFMALTGGNMLQLAETTDLQAMPETGRGTVVACGEDPPVANQGCAHAAPDTGGALGHKLDNIQKIIIPGGPSGLPATAQSLFLPKLFHA